MFGRLEEMFDRSEKMSKQKGKASKKREASNLTAVKAARSHPDVSQTGTSRVPKRASSYPSHALPLGVDNSRQTSIQPRAHATAMPASNPATMYSPSMTPESNTSGFNPAERTIYGNSQPFLPSQASQQVPAEAYPGSMSDLNAIMFPSGDPFAYPNPPMLTLEQNYGPNPHQNPFTMGQNQFLPVSTAGASSMNVNDHVDVQLFGQMPGHLIPTTTGSQQQANYGFSMSNVMNDEQQQPLELRKQELWSRQLDGMLRGSEWQGQYSDF